MSYVVPNSVHVACGILVTIGTHTSDLAVVFCMNTTCTVVVLAIYACTYIDPAHAQRKISADTSKVQFIV